MTADTNTRLAALAGTRNYDTLPNSCRCGTRWAGTNTCHCGACHQYTFVGSAAFDRHRKGGECHDPRKQGMSRSPGRAYEAWTIAETGTEDPS